MTVQPVVGMNGDMVVSDNSMVGLWMRGDCSNLDALARCCMEAVGQVDGSLK
jgi:hypothetical protein